MYEYIYEEGKETHPILILLHGTGGDERNLLPVAELLDSEATVLSIRGNVSEKGMNRYFKRHGKGQYDWEDLEQRGKELYAFIKNLSKKYSFSLEDAMYLGFSNGSNIAINILLREETKVNKAMLFAPMYPREIDKELDLSNRELYLSMGEKDPIVPLKESQRVIKIFRDSGASVTDYWVNSHELNQATLLAGKEWYEKVKN